MKILTGIDIPFNPFGGSPIICDDWYSAMEKEHDILFLTMPPTVDKQWWKMSNVHFLSTEKIRDPQGYPTYIKSLSKEIEKIIKSFEPDIIHLQHLNFGLSRAFVEIKSDIPKIGICHGTDTQVAQKYDFFKNNLIEITDQVDHLVFPAKNMMSDFFEVYEKEKPFSIFPHGIPDRFFDSHKLHQQEKTLRLLYAGRLNTYKGADIAVESLSYVNTDVILDVIGNEDEPGYMDKLKEIVQSNSLENIVSFYPQISREELVEKYSQYDAILIPSRYLEAFSLTSIEAQSRGLPVIYGNGGGISNVVGESGYLIEDNKPQTLAKIIDEINMNRNLLGELRNKGYINAENFRLSKQIESLLELSTKLINKDH